MCRPLRGTYGRCLKFACRGDSRVLRGPAAASRVARAKPAELSQGPEVSQDHGQHCRGDYMAGVLNFHHSMFYAWTWLSGCMARMSEQPSYSFSGRDIPGMQQLSRIRGSHFRPLMDFLGLLVHSKQFGSSKVCK